MNKHGVSRVIKYFNKNLNVKDPGSLLNISSVRSTVNNSIDYGIWGVIGTQDQVLLRRKKLSGDTKRHIKEIQISAIRILASCHVYMPFPTKSKYKPGYMREIRENFDVNNLIFEKLNVPGQALELFTTDTIRRQNYDNPSLKIENISQILDNRGIDFMSVYRGIKFGVQLTYRDEKMIKVEEKKEKTHNISVLLDNPQAKNPYNGKNLGLENFSIKQALDLPVFMIINSQSSKKLYESACRGKGRMNFLKKAYILWKADGFPKGGPIQEKYLHDRKVVKEFNIIGKTYPLLLEEFSKFIQNSDTHLGKNKNYIGMIGENMFHVDYRNYKFKISFFKKMGNKEDFVYSLEFYITQKLLNKLGIQKTIQRNFRKDFMRRKT